MSRIPKISLLALLVAIAPALAVTSSSALTINIYGGSGAPTTIGTPGGAIALPSATPALPAPAPVTALPSLAPVTPSARTVDGTALYNQYCSSCHGQSKRGASASSIQSAINSNKGGMGSLRSLTSAQIAAISGSSAGSTTTSSTRTSRGDD